MPRELVAIHQPNFFPWLGYFDKIARADRFVLMDNVQFSKTGGTWTNRVQLLVGGRPAWVTMPVRRDYHGTRRVSEMQIDESVPWRAKLLRTLGASYGRAPCFGEVFALVEKLLASPSDRVAELNASAIRELAALLRLDASKIVLGSSLACEGQATDLLVSMVRAAGGDAYLCGGGAAGYQEDEKFAAAGIEIVRQDFRHPVYAQHHGGEFVPGLSVLDALMSVGAARTRELLGR
jgi:hypothetical protein